MRLVIVTYSDAPECRKENVKKMQEHLKNEGVDVEVYVGGKNYIENIYNALKTSKEDTIMMEDDIILCKDFMKNVQKAIQEHPDKVINFFNVVKPCSETKEYEGHLWTECQCVFLPKRVVYRIVDLKESFKRNLPKSYERNLADNYLAFSIREPWVQYIPCLVQQNAFKSTIYEGNIDSQTIFFIDDL